MLPPTPSSANACSTNVGGVVTTTMRGMAREYASGTNLVPPDSPTWDWRRLTRAHVVEVLAIRGDSPH